MNSAFVGYEELSRSRRRVLSIHKKADFSVSKSLQQSQKKLLTVIQSLKVFT